MTVHMVRLKSQNPTNVSDQKIKTVVQGWVDRHENVLTTQQIDLWLVKQHPDNDVEHYRGDWRFSWSEDPVTILDDLESDLQQYVDWYRIKYHECTHDPGNFGTDSWDQTREYGTVPAGL